MSKVLIKAGALRQFQHNDESGLVAGYDITITNREFARVETERQVWQEAYENMRKFAEDNGLDTVTSGEPVGAERKVPLDTDQAT